MLALLANFFACPPFWGNASDAEEPPPAVGDNPGAFLYADGSIHDFDLTITPDAWDGLGREKPDVHATLTYEGVSWDVGLHLKGSSTFTGMGGKPSFKIDLGQWVEHQKMLGVRRITLNAMKFDPTMLREHAAYRLFAQMGVPAPRHGYARVSVNGEPYGLYGIVESMDEQFVRRNWPADSEGNLYDTVYNWADLTGLGLSNYVLQEGKPLEPYQDLHDLVDTLNRENIMDVLDRWFDRDEVLAMFAVDLATGNWDGYSRNTNNYLLYHATLEDKWHFIPWGQDFAFQGGGTLYMGVSGRVVSACLSDGPCHDALDARILDVLDEWEGGDLLGYTQEAWSHIRSACEADERKDHDCAPEKLLDALEDRPEPLRAELE